MTSMKFQFIGPDVKMIDLLIGRDNSHVMAIYSSTSSLKQEAIRKIVYSAILDYAYLLQENIPEELLKKERLMTRKEAIVNIHFPETEKKRNEALKRFMIEEILLLEMGILQNRFETDRANNNIYMLDDNRNLVKQFIESLGYTLTGAQRKVIKQIH